MINEYYNEDTKNPELSNGLDKKNYYLGSVTQVSMGEVILQVDNLTLLAHRMLRQSDLVPNTINYYVVIDSTDGIFLGRIIKNYIPVSQYRKNKFDEMHQEQIVAEAIVVVLGFQTNGSRCFMLPGFARPGITDKVYLANEAIIKDYVSSIEVSEKELYSSKRIEHFAHLSNYKNVSFGLRSSTLFNRHLMIVGTTNSGKSTTALSILNQLVNSKKRVILIDPTGEYKKSFSSSRKKEMQKLVLGIDTFVSPGALSIHDWSTIFECNKNTQESILFEAIKSLRYQEKNNLNNQPLVKKDQYIQTIQYNLNTVNANDVKFNPSMLPEQIMEEAVIEDKDRYKENKFRKNIYGWLREKVETVLSNTSFKQFFDDTSGSARMDLFKELDYFYQSRDESLYIDASAIGTTDSIGGIIINLVCEYLLKKPKCEENGYVIFVDEVHRYAKDNSESDSFHSGLTSIAREGRKKGIFLFLTTQNPSDVSPELLGQVGTLIIHRLTHSKEIDAIQNYVSRDSIDQIIKLNQGEAILSSVNLLEDLHLSIDACSRIHENKTLGI